ncbi:MAG: o-succinylbenzoate synthase [Chloroflexi bacterium]|nr:MAG: o-succinylbenzoate synthase [Chloroflexota bacterium]
MTTSPAQRPGDRRIAAVRWRTFSLPMRHRFEAAHSTLTSREGLVLELLGGGGESGIGEASPFPALGDGTLADTLALLEARAGAIALDPEAALAALPASGPGVMALRCALDTALLDLDAKERGVPVATLLSGAAWVAVDVNAVIGGGTPDEVATYAREASASGYTVLKLKVGVGSIADDVARVRAVREACPDAALRLDANGAWDEATAREGLAALAPFRIELIEQPVRVADLDGLARVRSDEVIRVAADEMLNSVEDAQRVIDAHAADLLVLKPMRLGGAHACLEIARRAAEAGIGCFATTTFDSSIGTALALHLAAALPEAPVAHGLSTAEHLASDLVAAPVTPVAGRLVVPGVPGLGVELDEAALEAVATGPWIAKLPEVHGHD